MKAAEKLTAKIGQGKPGPGRPKGVPNKSTGLLKDAILKAAAAADPTATDASQRSLEGYLQWAAKEVPGPFLGLLGKVLPMTLAGEGGGNLVVEIIRLGHGKNPPSGE